MAESSSDAISAPNLAGFSTPPVHLEGRVVKRRNRIPVSCGPCRTRRSKCDRNLPCSACDKRGEGHLCNYAKAVDKHKKAPEPDGKRHNPHGVHDRLQHLESLVVRLIGKEQNAPAPPGPSPYQDASTTSSTSYPPTTSALSDATFPSTTVDSAQPHWSAILNGIQELRSAIHHEEESAEPSDSVFDADDRPILLAATRPASLAAILSDNLPSRSECDRRLTQYFRTPFITINVVHSALFEEQYRQFWQAPSNTDPIWCALLFALLSLSAHISMITGVSPSEGDSSDRFAHAVAACLNMVGYSRPRPFLLPALLLLAQSSYIRNYDPTPEVGIILSIVTRLAFQAGIHREPHLSSTTSVFDAEMNRRLWVMLRHFDLQTASQFGIPSSIPPNSFDVQEPRNLLDSDLSPDMTVLPPSRPDSEPTPLTSFLIKHRLMNLFSTIYNNACAPWDTMTDADVQQFDAEVHRVRENMPAPYRSRPVESSFTMDQHVIMTRVTCELLAQKSICILHRRRMGLGITDSHTACMKAAGSIVETMTDFMASLKPGGALEGQAWMITSTNVNDTLLGSMVLVMGTVIEDKQKKAAKKDVKWSDDHVQLLNKARALSAEFSVRSKGAKRVTAAINTLFRKAGTEKDENLDPSLGGAQAIPPMIQSPAPAQQYGVANSQGSNALSTSAPSVSMPQSMPMSTDAMSSLAAAAAQLSPEGGFENSANKAPVTQNNQTYGAGGYAWAGPTPAFDNSQHPYPGHFIQGPSQSPATALDAFEQLFGAIGGGDQTIAGVGEAQRGEIDWSAFDQFITTGDPIGWSANV
ncbi:hypothetical protein DV736_g5473, partial [Chaetothyriales sp. CBS 134916]